MNEYPCRKCGSIIQEGQRRCARCGARQPKYGFYIDNGTSRPINGFSLVGFGMGLGCWPFVIIGILIAAAGIVFCIVGLVLARIRGQSGTLFSVLGLLLNLAYLVFMGLIYLFLFGFVWVVKGLGY